MNRCDYFVDLRALLVTFLGTLAGDSGEHHLVIALRFESSAQASFDRLPFSLEEVALS